MELILRQKDDVSLEELSRLFSAESQKRASMIIDTVLGRTVLYLNDVKSIVIDDGDGNQRDITNGIMGGMKK